MIISVLSQRGGVDSSSAGYLGALPGSVAGEGDGVRLRPGAVCAMCLLVCAEINIKARVRTCIRKHIQAYATTCTHTTVPGEFKGVSLAWLWGVTSIIVYGGCIRGWNICCTALQ